jgi:hypothetical protein
MYGNNKIELSEEIMDNKIKSVKLTENQIFIEFFQIDKYIILRAIGDCCSYSWFEFNNESFMSSLLNKCIKEIIVGDELGDGCLKIMPVTIITDNGKVNFELKNESNGYYSGWIEIKEKIKINKI